MQSTQIFFEQAGCDQRLNELGWSRNELLEVVFASVAARSSATLNDPLGTAGWLAWQQGVRRLREVGITKGWTRIDLDRIPYIYNASSQVKITVANTDEGTGMPSSLPQNRSKKGAATERLVEINQFTFSRLLEESENPEGAETTEAIESEAWYLCIFSEDDVVRAELSCPVECTGGYLSSFRERIILLGDEGSSPIKRIDPVSDGGEDFSVEVTRKTV